MDKYNSKIKEFLANYLRPRSNLLLELGTPLLSLLIALAVGAIVIIIIGENPLSFYKVLFGSALGRVTGWGNVIYNATGLIFTGLAVAFAFRCGLFNIGGEGQMMIGTFLATWVGFTFTNLPSVLHIPLCILMAMVGGALWASLPGFLKARFGVHEVINTIMLNWISLSLTFYLVLRYKAPATEAMKKAGVKQMIPRTADIIRTAWLPRLHDVLAPLGIDFPANNPANASILIAIVAILLTYYLLWKTKWGYEIRAVGYNPSAAEYSGISVTKNIILAMAISGAFAGLVVTNQVMGFRHHWRQELFTGLGFGGIGVALLGKCHPFGIVLSALLFATLNYGALAVDVFFPKVPRELVMVLEALIIILVVVSDEIIRRKLQRRLQEREAALGET